MNAMLAQAGTFGRGLTILLVLGACAWAEPPANLLPNGSFDEGEDTPLHWERANGLTTFYVREEGRGRIVKMDTQVDRLQALDWMKAFAADPTLPPPAKTPIGKESFATIGGNEGVMLDSDFIAAVPGQNYRLTADIKGDGAPFVWIKGFQKHPKRDAYVDAYQTRLVGNGASPSAWKTYAIGFNPTARMPKVERFKVRLYAFWPNGLYYFDNVRIDAITPEEMAELVKARETPGPVDSSQQPAAAP